MAARNPHLDIPTATSAMEQTTKAHTMMERGGLMREYYPLNYDPMLELCLTGKCDCRSAAECKFARCKNCDSCVGPDGKTLEDWCGWAEIFEVCPDCGNVLTRS
jgi:hypothetical protein